MRSGSKFEETDSWLLGTELFCCFFWVVFTVFYFNDLHVYNL